MEDTLSHLVDQVDNLVLGEGTANDGWVSVPKLLGFLQASLERCQEGEIQCLGQVGCVWSQESWPLSWQSWAVSKLKCQKAPSMMVRQLQC